MRLSLAADLPYPRALRPLSFPLHPAGASFRVRSPPKRLRNLLFFLSSSLSSLLPRGSDIPRARAPSFLLLPFHRPALSLSFFLSLSLALSLFRSLLATSFSLSPSSGQPLLLLLPSNRAVRRSSRGPATLFSVSRYTTVESARRSFRTHRCKSTVLSLSSSRS